jgi:hypothetical protein
MKVDAPGLVAAAQRLVGAVQALGVGTGVPHPPLAADPTSVGAAGRLTAAGAQLIAALDAHVAALVASVELLTGAAMSYLATDEANAAAIAALDGGRLAAAGVAGAAPPAPPIPADVRAPLAPPAGMAPEAISAATHAGTPGGGESFIGAWSQAAGAALDAAAAIRSTVAHLPETLDGPASTPAVSAHLLSFADGLDTYADRALTLASQAKTYADNQIAARVDVPQPQQLADAHNRVLTLARANAASGGKWAAQLAAAVAEKNQLDQQAVSGDSVYHVRTEAATAGDDPGTGDQGPPGDPTAPGAADAAFGQGSGQPDPAGGVSAPQTGAEMAKLPTELVSPLLGAAGSLVSDALGAVAKGPQALVQTGTQALGAVQNLSGLAHPKLDPPGTGKPGRGAGEAGDPSGAGGGDAPTTPAAGDGSADLPVAPSTGAPPTPAIPPVGAAGGPEAGGAAGGAAPMTPMGMPMGGLAGAPGGGGAAGKDAAGRPQKIETREIPHTEDVTGRVDTSRLSAAAAASHRDRGTEPPPDDSPPDPAGPVVRRLVTRAPEEPS